MNIKDRDPDSEYLGMKLNRNRSGRVVLAFGSVLAKAGDQVRFTGTSGYEWERERASKLWEVGHILTVERISVGLSSSKYYFVNVPGDYNTVMFDRVTRKRKAK